MKKRHAYICFAVSTIIIYIYTVFSFPLYALMATFIVSLIVYAIFICYFYGDEKNKIFNLYIIFLTIIFIVLAVNTTLNNFTSESLGYDSIKNLSNTFNYDFVNSIILASYAIFTLKMVSEMEKSRKQDKKNALNQMEKSEKNSEEVSNQMKVISAELSSISKSLKAISAKKPRKRNK